jgi:predicted transcriptional regulator YdeE
MKHTNSTVSLPAKEFLVIKGIVKLYDSEDSSIPSSDDDTWSTIKQRLNDGSVERLKKAAGSETAYILFCNTCVRNDADKCYDCGCDIACENLGGAKAADGFEIVRLLQCEYALFDCDFSGETTMPKAHEKPDSLFWGEWLKENPYVSAIDDPANWLGNGYASIELYTPFDPATDKFNAKIWYPIIRKENENG